MKSYNDTPLLSAFNRVGNSVIQWCTPSIHMEVPRVSDIYGNDVSVSYHSLGNPCTNTGIFLAAHQLAAQAYGADYTLFSVNGSTGSNFIVLRALKRQLGKIKLLAQRNVHKSIVTAAEDYGIDITYIPLRYHNDLQIFIPNTIDEIVAQVKQYKPNVLLITNPTYEGISLYLPELIEKVKKINKNLIVFVDEAWGAHFAFSKKMPVCAMQAGVDICVQSTHKQGSGLQQTSMIHWKKKLIDYDSVLDSYTALTTTSPSYHLLASLDGARHFMQYRGEGVIDAAIERAAYMRKQINLIPEIHAYEPRELIRAAGAGRLQIDATKILLHLQGHSGMELSQNLEQKYAIIVEKYESENILLIMKLQNYREEIDNTVDAIRKEMRLLSNEKKIKFPEFPSVIEKKMPAYRAAKSAMQSIKINSAIGRVMAENIIPYPPGIPLIVKGEIFQAEHLQYLKALKKTGGLITVMMNDKTINTIIAVKQTA